MKNLNKKLKTIIILFIILSVSGTTIFLGLWFRPIKVIEINEDKDFSRKYHFPGKGTEEDPYIIEGYEFSGNEDFNIKISRVTKHFIIRNCILENSYKSLYLNDLTDGIALIVNNTIRNNHFGLWMSNNKECIISNNTFLNNNRTIYANEGSYSIESNIFENSKQNLYPVFGVTLHEVHDIVVANNNFSTLTSGVHVGYSENVQISKNNFQNCYSFAYKSYENINITITNNSATNSTCGFIITNCQNLFLINNTSTDNKEEGFLLNSISNGLISGNNASGNDYYGIKAYDITNTRCQNNFFHRNNISGIRMTYSDFSTINNNSIKNNGLGIDLADSENIQVYCNIIQHNLEYGIVTAESNATIWNNNFIDNDYTNISTILAQAKAEMYGYDAWGEIIEIEDYTKWFKEETKRGNYWSDLEWFDGVEYSIDPGNNTDSYPLEEQVEIQI